MNDRGEGLGDRNIRCRDVSSSAAGQRGRSRCLDDEILAFVDQGAIRSIGDISLPKGVGGEHSGECEGRAGGVDGDGRGATTIECVLALTDRVAGRGGKDGGIKLRVAGETQALVSIVQTVEHRRGQTMSLAQLWSHV